MKDDGFYGFDELEQQLKDYVEKASSENVMNVLEYGASEFVKILLKLPKPRSRIMASGYTHLVDSFSYKRNGSEVEVGWGKYYGSILEKGKAPHLMNAWGNNKEKIYQLMIDRSGFKKG